ncbi:MAG: glycoside hydrolase family 65 protein [Culicoidibacterales bacterium]
MYTRLFAIDDWKIIENELHKNDFRLAESMTSLGNGHMGMRGNFEETYSGDMHQGSYVAGVWFPDKTRVGWWKNGYPHYFGKVINSTNYIGIQIFIDGQELDLYTANVTEFYRELDLQNGVLTRRFTIAHEDKTTHCEVVRFLSVAKTELAAISYTVIPQNYRAKVTFVPYLDGNVRNEDTNYDENFWQPVTQAINGLSGHVVMQTIENQFGTPQFCVATAMKVETVGEVEAITTQEEASYVAVAIEMIATPEQPAAIKKFISVTTDRDYEATQLLPQAQAVLATVQDFETELQLSQAGWLKRWEQADIEITGDSEAQQGIRFNLFQLFATYYGEDARLNIGPKGFTGEKYGGATYWDTEAYCLPVYLGTTNPDIARNLLIYRHEQLPGAIHNAQQQGLQGALYPMVTFNGIECHNEWEITFEEIHRNGSMAYGIYNYVNYTGDKNYLHEYGIDVLTQISRFWADRVHYSKRHDAYMMHGVTGPNEYENNINNNWYTNFMAQWTLAYTLEVIAELKATGHEAAIAKNAVTEAELVRWQTIINKMYLPYDEELGVFVQHDTFLDKELMTVDELDPSQRPLNQKWSWDRILRSCFIKQADVLQGVYYFPERFSLEEKRRNFEFYEPMTVHESSLSPSIHAILAAELGMEAKAVEMYERTARLDLDNYNNDTEDGLHITSMTGSWLAIVQGFAGMRTANEKLSFAPFVPTKWDGYSFKINYRGSLIKVQVNKLQVTFTLETGTGVTLDVFNQTYQLTDGLTIPLG